MRTVPTRHRPLLLVIVLATVLGSLAVGGASASALTPGKVPTFDKAIEGYAPYQSQTTCAKSASKGATLLSTWLLARYKGSTSSGIMRACGTGGRSEHKDGRAFDWHVDYRTTRGRAQGLAFMQLVRATDKYGNRSAIARRMGIMYFIWNDRIYSASNGFAAQPYRNAGCGKLPLATCSTTLRHIDHMHISLGWSGAKAITSFWDGTVAGVTPAPSAPRPKPAPKPVVPVLNQTAHPVVDLWVGAKNPQQLTTFSLRAGTTYRLVATGHYRYGTGTRVADSGCSWHLRDDAGWAKPAEGTTSSTRLKLLVAGTARWTSVRGGDCDSRTHTYVWDYTPRTTGPVRFGVDDAPASDNSGSLTLRILKAGAPTSAYSSVIPAARPEPAAPAQLVQGDRLRAAEQLSVSPTTGARTTGWLRAGRAYDVTVTGTWGAGDGLVADGECTKTASGTWQRQRSADPMHPELDSYDLYVDGFDLQSKGCTADHTYTYRYVPLRDGNATFALWDPNSTDDTGSVQVVVTPVR